MKYTNDEMYKVYELMRTLVLFKGAVRIRLWIKTNENFEFNEELLIEIMDFCAARFRFNSNYSLNKLCKEIGEEFEDILSAVEVVNKQGDGSLVYPDWD